MFPNKIVCIITKIRDISQLKTTQTCSRDSNQPILGLQQSNFNTNRRLRRANEQRSQRGIAWWTAIELKPKKKNKLEWQSKQVRSRNHHSMSLMSLCHQTNDWGIRTNQLDFETLETLATSTLSSSFTTRCLSLSSRYSVSKTKWTDKIRLFPSRTRNQVLHFKTRRSIQGSS